MRYATIVNRFACTLRTVVTEQIHCHCFSCCRSCQNPAVMTLVLLFDGFNAIPFFYMVTCRSRILSLYVTYTGSGTPWGTHFRSHTIVLKREEIYLSKNVYINTDKIHLWQCRFWVTLLQLCFFKRLYLSPCVPYMPIYEGWSSSGRHEWWWAVPLKGQNSRYIALTTYEISILIGYL